ncbi:MATE family efflux transporter [Chloroflexota bacterium]
MNRDRTGGPGGRSAIGRDWTQGNIFRNLILLSWPIIVSNSLNMLGPTIDMIWVGRLGAAAIAGVGVSGMAVMLINSLMMSLNMGSRAMIARFMGAGNIEGANKVAQQSFIIIFAFAMLLVPTGIFLAEPILVLMGLEPEVVAEGAAYMRILFVGGAAMSFRMMTEGIMQASGDTVSPMWIAVLFRVFHIVLCPFLIFGWWIFPQMGVSGAALTNVLSQSIGLVAGLVILFRGRTRLKLTLHNFRIDFSLIWRIIRIAIPSSVSGMQRGLGQLVIMRFIVPFGTFAVAAHTLVQRVEMFIMMPGMGLGMGGGTLAGQNLGAGQPERAEKSVWMALGVVEGFVAVSATALLLWAENVIGIFSPGPEVIEVAATFVRIAAIGFFVFSAEPVLMTSLNNVGDTVPPMIAAVCGFWLIQVPLAYFLPQIAGLGVYGVRWGMVGGMFAAAVALAIYFKLGRWKNKRI